MSAAQEMSQPSNLDFPESGIPGSQNACCRVQPAPAFGTACCPLGQLEYPCIGTQQRVWCVRLLNVCHGQVIFAKGYDRPEREQVCGLLVPFTASLSAFLAAAKAL